MDMTDKAYFESLDRQDQISEMIKCIHLFYEKALNRRMARANITGVQLQTLLYLKFNAKDEVNPVDIERRLNLSRPTVTGILKRLELKSFVTFGESRKDKRYKQVILTEAGAKCLDECREDLISMNLRLCGSFEDKELDEIYNCLFKMLENLKESEEKLC